MVASQTDRPAFFVNAGLYSFIYRSANSSIAEVFLAFA